MKKTSYSALSLADKKMLDVAEAVMKNAYNPYSHFFVGAALRTTGGTLIGGANVENAAYGSTICAERSAILHANALGHRTFSSIAIIGRGESFDVTDPISPCGSCRQMLNEVSQIAGADLRILLSNTKKNKIIVTSIAELLPLPFGPRDLGINVKKYH